MTEELYALYLEAFCGLVCPFPRLAAIRYQLRQPITEINQIDWKEYTELSLKESEYYMKKAIAKGQFYELYNKHQRPS